MNVRRAPAALVPVGVKWAFGVCQYVRWLGRTFLQGFDFIVLGQSYFGPNNPPFCLTRITRQIVVHRTK